MPEEAATDGRTALELADWRRRVAGLYARVRDEDDPAAAHALWRTGRDALFREHPQSPLPATSPLRESGLPCWPYDPALRLEVPLRPVPAGARTLELPSGETGSTLLRAVGTDLGSRQVAAPAAADDLNRAVADEAPP